MQELRMTEQPVSEVEVDQKFSFAFFCPYTTCPFSGVLKKFTPMNSFATAKLVNLETHEDHEDDSYILGRPQANLSDDVTDRVIRFEIEIRVPGSYRILISMHGKTSDPNTPIHYPVLADLWTEDIRVCVSTLDCLDAAREDIKSQCSDDRAGHGTEQFQHWKHDWGRRMRQCFEWNCYEGRTGWFHRWWRWRGRFAISGVARGLIGGSGGDRIRLMVISRRSNSCLCPITSFACKVLDFSTPSFQLHLTWLVVFMESLSVVVRWNTTPRARSKLLFPRIALDLVPCQVLLVSPLFRDLWHYSRSCSRVLLGRLLNAPARLRMIYQY